MDHLHAQKCSRILIVEDEKLVIWSLSETLKRAGYLVTAVESGEKAIEELHRSHFDVLITDMNLPNVDGFEVALAAKKLKPSIPVIMMTADAIRGNEKSWSAAGIDFVVEKPFDLKEVTLLVEQCVSHVSEA